MAEELFESSWSSDKLLAIVVRAGGGWRWRREKAGWFGKAVRRFEGSPVKYLAGIICLITFWAISFFLILSELPIDLFAIYSGDRWEVSRPFDSQRS